MVESESPGRSPLRFLATILVVVIIPLAVGLYAAPRLVEKPQVGVIRLNYDIFGATAYEITEQLDYARNDDAIQAVVLIINSPGGSAAYSEELYLDVLHTRRQMPVVASVDLLAASGAYYMAAAADEIYAKPTSSVGSVGVIAALPGDVYIQEDILTTGPYKAFGGTRDGVMRQVERAKYTFLEAVAMGRNGRLQIDTETLSRAEIYSGVRAWELGLVDELGATEEAVARAAELAGFREYDAVELYPLTFDTAGQYAFGSYQPPSLDAAKLWANPTHLPPGLYYRHLELPANQ